MLARKKTPWVEFEALVRAHHRDFLVLAHRVLGDANLVEDALQDAYLRAYRSYQGGGITHQNLNGWLYRIVYHSCIDLVRHKQRLAETPTQQITETLETLAPAAAPDADGALAQGLAALAPEDRAAVVLVDALGFDYASAAETLGVPVGTIGSRLHRARTSLRSQLLSASTTRRERESEL